MKNEFKKIKNILGTGIIFTLLFLGNFQRTVAQIILSGPLTLENPKLGNQNLLFGNSGDAVFPQICQDKTITVTVKNNGKSTYEFSGAGNLSVNAQIHSLASNQTAPIDDKLYYQSLQTGSLAPGASIKVTITMEADFGQSGKKNILFFIAGGSSYVWANSYIRLNSSPSTRLSSSVLNPCVGSEVTLTALQSSGTKPLTYLFHPNHDADYTKYNAAFATVIIPTTEGKKTWNVTVKDGNGCTYTDTVTGVTVRPASACANLVVSINQQDIHGHFMAVVNEGFTISKVQVHIVGANPRDISDVAVKGSNIDVSKFISFPGTFVAIVTITDGHQVQVISKQFAVHY